MGASTKDIKKIRKALKKAIKKYYKKKYGINFTFDGDIYSQITILEIFYFRKHPNLRTWILNNCKYDYSSGINEYCYRLTLEHIVNLKNDAKNNSLPVTTGSFFGTSYEEYLHRTIDFCNVAERLFKIYKNLEITYTDSY